MVRRFDIRIRRHAFAYTLIGHVLGLSGLALVVGAHAPAHAAKPPKKQKAAEPEGGDANAHYNRGVDLMKSIEPQLRSGKLSDQEKVTAKQAEDEYRKAIELAKNHGRAHIMLGMLYRFTGRENDAIALLKKGMELPPDSKDWWIAASTLVDVYFLKNDAASAIPVLEKILKHHTEDATSFYRLGLCYSLTNRKDEAKSMLKKALAIAPGHADAQNLLNQLGGN